MVAAEANKDAAERLRAQMQADALQPLDTDLLGDSKASTLPLPGKVVAPKSSKMKFDEDTVQDTRDWVQLNVRSQHLLI